MSEKIRSESSERFTESELERAEKEKRLSIAKRLQVMMEEMVRSVESESEIYTHNPELVANMVKAIIIMEGGRPIGTVDDSMGEQTVYATGKNPRAEEIGVGYGEKSVSIYKLVDAAIVTEHEGLVEDRFYTTPPHGWEGDEVAYPASKR